MKSNIQKVNEQYAMFPYNPTCIHAVNNVELHLALDDQLFLTTFAVHKRCLNSVLFERENNERIKLLDKIKQLEILMNSNDSEHIIQKLTDAKTVWKNSVDILKDYL